MDNVGNFDNASSHRSTRSSPAARAALAVSGEAVDPRSDREKMGYDGDLLGSMEKPFLEALTEAFPNVHSQMAVMAPSWLTVDWTVVCVLLELRRVDVKTASWFSFEGRRNVHCIDRMSGWLAFLERDSPLLMAAYDSCPPFGWLCTEKAAGIIDEKDNWRPDFWCGSGAIAFILDSTCSLEWETAAILRAPRGIDWGE